MAWAWSIISVHTGKRSAPSRGGMSLQGRGISNSCSRVVKPAPPNSSQLDGVDHVAAGDVEVAGEADEGGGRPLVLHAVGVVDHRGGARHHGGRLGGGVEDGRLADLAPPARR